jgi:cephalosporin-C deacetylase-like acetyl esterase
MQMLSAITGLLLVPFAIGAPAAWIGGHYCTVFNSQAPHVIVLFHGYLADPTSYYPVGLSFAAAGYAVVIPRDNNDLDAITQASDWGTTVSAAVRDWAYPRKVAVVGHSMGGAAAMAAAKFTPGLSSFVAMHPAPILSGSTEMAVNGPILFTTGTTDDGNVAGATAPSTAMDSYNIALAPKALVNVRGDGHGSPQSLSGMQWSSVMAWLGCFTKQHADDCKWVEAQMCKDPTLEWCSHAGVGLATQAAAVTGIHV